VCSSDLVSRSRSKYSPQDSRSIQQRLSSTLSSKHGSSISAIKASKQPSAAHSSNTSGSGEHSSYLAHNSSQSASTYSSASTPPDTETLDEQAASILSTMATGALFTPCLRSSAATSSSGGFPLRRTFRACARCARAGWFRSSSGKTVSIGRLSPLRQGMSGLHSQRSLISHPRLSPFSQATRRQQYGMSGSRSLAPRTRVPTSGMLSLNICLGRKFRVLQGRCDPYSSAKQGTSLLAPLLVTGTAFALVQPACGRSDSEITCLAYRYWGSPQGRNTPGNHQSLRH